MKNLMLTTFVLLTMIFATGLQAQTACTPAQKAACKKVCAKKTTCSPQEVAACKKTCKKQELGTSSTSVAKTINQAPSDKKSEIANKTTTKDSPAKLVGLELFPDTKKETSCSKPCVAADKKKQ